MAGVKDLGRARIVGAFEQAAGASTSIEQLSSLTDAIVRELGFKYFSLLHNVDLARRSAHALLLTSYPAAWLDEVIERRLYLDDPVHAACTRATDGLSWDRMTDYIRPSMRQYDTLAKGRAHGLANGFTMGIEMTDEPLAIFTIARSIDQDVTAADTHIARLLGNIALGHGRLLLGADRLGYRRISLSPRQIDCIALVAQGKSDWDIAQILGISRETVHEYVETARKRYGVRRRIQLVLRVVRDGHLAIDTLL